MNYLDKLIRGRTSCQIEITNIFFPNLRVWKKRSGEMAQCLLLQHEHMNLYPCTHIKSWVLCNMPSTPVLTGKIVDRQILGPHQLDIYLKHKLQIQWETMLPTARNSGLLMCMHWQIHLNTHTHAGWRNGNVFQNTGYLLPEWVTVRQEVSLVRLVITHDFEEKQKMVDGM